MNSARTAVVCAAIALATTSAWAQAPRTPAPQAAKVYFISPKNGDTVRSPVKIVMGLSGMGVAPAGTDAPDTGHHHILVDASKLPAFDAPMPVDSTYRHFGKGHTETTLELPPGKHTLQLVLGDKNHIPHNPPVMSDKITITVVK